MITTGRRCQYRRSNLHFWKPVLARIERKGLVRRYLVVSRLHRAPDSGVGIALTHAEGFIVVASHNGMRRERELIAEKLQSLYRLAP